MMLMNGRLVSMLWVSTRVGCLAMSCYVCDMI